MIHFKHNAMWFASNELNTVILVVEAGDFQLNYISIYCSQSYFFKHLHCLTPFNFLHFTEIDFKTETFRYSLAQKNLRKRFRLIKNHHIPNKRTF